MNFLIKNFISSFGSLRAKLRLTEITKSLPSDSLPIEKRINFNNFFGFKRRRQTSSNKTNSEYTSKNELSLMYHELDKEGNLQVKSGKFPKLSLCMALGLQARDLRKLDGTLKDQLPSILVRESALLINCEYIKAVIKFDGVILFESTEIEERIKQHQFLLDLQSKLRSNPSGPLEFTVIETILQTILQSLQDELDKLAPGVENHLQILEKFVHWDKLKIMLDCKKRVCLFTDRINSIKNCISEVLESDIDMSEMYLTAKKVSLAQPRPISAHQEVELLLETYLKIAEEISGRAKRLSNIINSTEDVVNIGLVSQRNELLLLELKLGIGTFAASMGGFGASILGMNLMNGMESSETAFLTVLSGILATATVAFVASWRRMLRLIKK
jgi:magnesium transporter